MTAPIQIVEISNGFLVSQQPNSQGQNASMTYCEDTIDVMKKVQELLPKQEVKIVKPN